MESQETKKKREFNVSSILLFYFITGERQLRGSEKNKKQSIVDPWTTDVRSFNPHTVKILLWFIFPHYPWICNIRSEILLLFIYSWLKPWMWNLGYERPTVYIYWKNNLHISGCTRLKMVLYQCQPYTSLLENNITCIGVYSLCSHGWIF